jgi:hypothetical protein
MAENRRHQPLEFELFESNETARSDMRLFLTRPDGARLVEVLAAEGDLVAAPEPSRNRVAKLAASLGIDVNMVWSSLRVIDWLCRNAEDIDIGTLVANLVDLELVRPDDAKFSAEFFEGVIDIFEPAFGRRLILSAVMKTFKGVEYACDLRAIGSDHTERDKDEVGFVPVCVVRIHNDEGEPFVFQCAIPDLDRLTEAFDNAKKLLSDALRKITESTTN